MKRPRREGLARAKREMNGGQEKFRQAALAYLAYGILYMAGALTLAAAGASPRAMGRGAWVWFGIGAVVLVLFPWLLWRGSKWFARLLVLLMALRAYGVLRVALAGGGPVPLPGGVSIPMAAGAWVFFLVTVAAAAIVARAAWQLGPAPERRGSP